MNPNIPGALINARTTIVLFLILSTYTGFSQSTFGLRAGPQLTTAPGASMRLNYHAGIFGSTRISDNVSIGADVLYSEKGFNLDKDAEASLTYLSIPMTAEYNFANRFSVLGGLEFNRLLTYDYPGKERERIPPPGWYATPFASKVDWSLVAGFGYQIHPKLSAQVRYSIALGGKAIFNHQQTAQFSLGYFLNKGGRSIPTSRTSRPDSSWISCGVKAGLNFSDTYYDASSDNDVSEPRLGGLFGLYVQARIFRGLSFIGEFQYIRKGYNQNDDGEKVPVLFDYIEVPLLLSFDFGKRISLDVGTSFGYRVREIIPKELERKFASREVDKEIVLGARWRTKRRISFGGRLYHGYTEIARYGGGANEYFQSLQFFTYYRL